ncbi:YrhK family protein [Oleiagrimonas citrea]|uniref:YrhK domain-containing protein n=1 Tax=Oleiagrimonas citrea TaxID=1665687 RepID=A0A846ZG77_9GAMM|nr:YrhK family protein [Oleiagrimonas citrea]NKZ37586.1 hypothetical protein [Oleiagrimonas citrea]
MSTLSPCDREEPRDLVVRIGRDELVIRRRYEVISIANDILIGLWFLVGTILFFDDATVYYGTWLFLIGSIEMLIRPTIRLLRHLHLQRFNAGQSSAVGDDDGDF